MKDGFVKVAAAAPEIRVADVVYNAKYIINCMSIAAKKGAKVLVFPELCVTGSTCGDLFFQRALLDAATDGLDRIADASRGLDMLVFVGLPIGGRSGILNCAAAIYEGEVLSFIEKTVLSSYEKRWFTVTPQRKNDLLIAHQGLGDLIVSCEIGSDLLAPNPTSATLALSGATIIVNPFAEPDYLTRDDFIRETVKNHSARLVCGYVHAAAGEGESTTDGVFTGHSIIAENGEILAENNAESCIIYSEIDVERLADERIRKGITISDEDSGLCLWDGELTDTALTRPISKLPFVPDDPIERSKRCERALYLQCLGLKKRILHTNAAKLVVGVSGGLDSTLAMLVCARTLKMLDRPSSDLIAVTMPGFGTTARTKSNAQELAELLGADFRTVPIGDTTLSHFRDIGHDPNNRNVTFENAQARERTQVLMDIANDCGGLVVGTGDLSELALGWATFNGDHMSMYCVNGGVPKTFIRYIIAYVADTDIRLKAVLTSILDTPVSPELLPPEDGQIAQITEDLVGPYELHDFFLYYAVRWGFPPKKVYRLAKYAFNGEYTDEIILKWLKTFYRRFFGQQFKRSCLPDGPKIGSLTLSPRGGWTMPSDAMSGVWMEFFKDYE